ncbi:hypothetical protein ElyMa_006834000 [Elysia marginata]|uniref:Mutator-like transposase domain-containing protein n=1 Tax=Elysia marginata TaxID=1093978 RepID=A0AAV4J970_9GAST|nr:hypothetical protein ElyMa_006834000 [Elysia marginata]
MLQETFLAFRSHLFLGHLPKLSPALFRSQKKLRLFQEHLREDIAIVSQTRTIVEIQQIRNIVAKLRCPECHSERGLLVNISKQYGLALKLDVVCDECQTTVTSQYTSSRNTLSSNIPQPFVANEACVLASLLAGMGAYNSRNFCEYLDLPGLHHKTF